MADRARDLNGDCMALWYVAPGEARLEIAPLRAVGEGQALVRALHSVISRGTERLIFQGRVPEGEHARMRCPLQEGDFPHPVKYGYCAVGVVEAGPDHLLGKTVFALHPHQDRFVCDIGWLTPVPENVPARRAGLAANMETALNALWDGGAGPGDRIVVVGGGVVGLLVAALAARIPGADVTVVDRLPSRRAVAEALGARFSDGSDLKGDADLVVHTTAHPDGLATALGAAANALEATLVELSWYGETVARVPLGGAFHSQRLRLISSQVGQVAPSRRPRWPYARRLAKALELLGEDRLDALLTDDIAFGDLPKALPGVMAAEYQGLTAVVGYR